MAADYGTFEALRARRVQYGPAYAAVPILLVGVTTHFLGTLETLLLLLAGAIGAGFWAARARGWRRQYYGIVAVVGAGWIVWAHAAPDTVRAWTWLLIMWVVATILLAVPWWADNVRRTVVKNESTIRTWKDTARRTGIPGTWMTDQVINNNGWTAMLRWRPGAYVPRQIIDRSEMLEGGLGLQTGQLRLPLNGRSTNSIKMVAVLRDPHAEAVPWEIPTCEEEGRLLVRRASATTPFEFAIREDGELKKFDIFVKGTGSRHVLVGGMTGSGKSGFLNVLWASLALCDDVVQWGIDLKGGMELGPWSPVFDWVVDSRAGAVEMLRALNIEADRRMAFCKKNGIRVWSASAETPVLVVSVDESASLLGNARQGELEMVEEIARKGRAVGISLVLATQYPTLEAVGSSQLRENIHHRLCFRMSSSSGERYVMPEHTVNAHSIPEERPGTCYHLAGDKLDRLPSRVLYMSDETVSTLNELLAGETATLGETVETELGGLVSLYRDRDRDTVSMAGRDWDRDDETGSLDDDETTEEIMADIPQWRDGDDVDLVSVTAARDAALPEEDRVELAAEREQQEGPARLDEEGAREALVSALRAAGSAGVSPRMLMDVSTRKSSWLYERLSELEDQGDVARTGSGVWAWCGVLVHSG